MNTPLESTSLTGDELANSQGTDFEDEQAAEEEGHIHLPGPSLWPFILSVAVLITIIGFLFVALWLVAIGAVLVLVGILGWALENPMAGQTEAHGEREAYATSFADAAISGKMTPFAEQVLQDAEDTVDRTVTISSTAWSAHPVKVFVEREGVVLSLYGKVELEAQKQEVEAELRKLPGVLDVMNFLVAEDELLSAVNALIANLQNSGKLEGASDLSVLVENGIVSLYGNVPKPEMKYMLEREISGIPGARVVVNHIGLNTDIPGNLGKTTNRIARI